MQHQHYCLNLTIKNATLTDCYLTTTISEMKLRHIHENCVIKPRHGAQTRLSASEDTVFIWLISSRGSNTVLHWQKPLHSSWMDNRDHTKESVRSSVLVYLQMKWNKYRSSTTRQAERKHTHEQMQDKEKVKRTAGLYFWPLPTTLVPTSTQNLPSSQMNCPCKFIFKHIFISVSSALCSFFFYSFSCASPLFFIAQCINPVAGPFLLHKDRWLSALSLSQHLP